jgi:hypothetical protein
MTHKDLPKKLIDDVAKLLAPKQPAVEEAAISPSTKKYIDGLKAKRSAPKEKDETGQAEHKAKVSGALQMALKKVEALGKVHGSKEWKSAFKAKDEAARKKWEASKKTNEQAEETVEEGFKKFTPAQLKAMSPAQRKKAISDVKNAVSNKAEGKSATIKKAAAKVIAKKASTSTKSSAKTEQPADDGWKFTHHSKPELNATIRRLHAIKDADLKHQAVRHVQKGNSLPDVDGPKLHDWAKEKFSKKQPSLAGKKV